MYFVLIAKKSWYPTLVEHGKKHKGFITWWQSWRWLCCWYLGIMVPRAGMDSVRERRTFVVLKAIIIDNNAAALIASRD